MPASSYQQSRVLRLAEYLYSKTDDTHAVSMKDIREALNAYGFYPSRTTLYSDITCLRDFGIDIIKTSDTKGARYHIGSRLFQETELKILVDCIQSSNFITVKKSEELIRKLERLTSTYIAKSLDRSVYVRNRIKNMEESVYINVDGISSAINSNRQIRFQYYDIDMNKKKYPRHNGKYYEVSPYAFVYVDQNYYLLAFYPPDNAIRHFRVDRIVNLETMHSERSGKEAFLNLDIATYTSKVFYMFTGEERKVRCRFASGLVRPVLDRFGQDSIIVKEGDMSFSVTLDVVVSPQFYAWMSAYGSDAEILDPPDVRCGYIAHLQGIVDSYTKTEDSGKT